MSDTKVTYYGHAMFVIETSSGTKIGTDPYNEQIKEPLPDVSADIVTTSHDHFDHGNIDLFKGDPQVVNNTGETAIGDIRFEGIPSFHDEKNGSLRGNNIIYKITADDIIFTHLGDLGHMLGQEQVENIKDTDVLFIPVGGVYTINAAQAVELIDKVDPRIAVPMHYKYKDFKLNVDEVSSFTRRVDSFKEAGSSIGISKASLPETTGIWVMSPA